MTLLKPIYQSFTVQHQYQLHFTEGVFDHGNTLLADLIATFDQAGPVKLLFVVDKGLLDHYSHLILDIKAYCSKYNGSLDLTKILLVSAGEASKNDNNQLETVLEEINDLSICRHSFVIAVGGGAVIDMAGYAAATAHRGVKIIRIPTTVLAQNDAAVGVKNGVNKFGKKNFIGAFATPFAIVNDLTFLKTLEQRDWISGIAEAIKVALIKDKVFFEYIRRNVKQLAERNTEAMSQVIYRCAELHMQHIAQGGDPFESGSSRPLDFGHWAAHKLEQMTSYQLRHGEAVAMGIALDVTYAHFIGLIDEKTLLTIVEVLSGVGFNLSLPIHTVAQLEELVKGLEEFREHLGGELTITLISGLGEKYDVHEIDMEKMAKAIIVRSGLKEELFC
ncbi:MAG: 3-dehydroquinate synthase [Bacteroidota bacterium]